MGNLSRGDWRLLAEAIALASLVELGLRFVPVDLMLAPAHREGCRRERAFQIDLQRTSRIVEGVFRHYPFRPSCLKKSLVLVCLARWHGHPAQLRIGVRKDRDELLAHAWVECAGRTLLLGDHVEPYHPLPPIAAATLASARPGIDPS